MTASGDGAGEQANRLKHSMREQYFEERIAPADDRIISQPRFSLSSQV
jgi:hypothetical protein